MRRRCGKSRVSWTLAAEGMTASGRPSVATTTWYLVPALPRSVGLGPVSSPPRLALVHADGRPGAMAGQTASDWCAEEPEGGTGAYRERLRAAGGRVSAGRWSSPPAGHDRPHRAKGQPYPPTKPR